MALKLDRMELLQRTLVWMIDSGWMEMPGYVTLENGRAQYLCAYQVSLEFVSLGTV